MIHGDHPFTPAEADRDPVRRLRGRLAAPVTIVTAGAGATRAGLTVSSVWVIEGDPPIVKAIVNPLTELWDAIESDSRFVVHVCDWSHRDLADVFAGLRPSPGGPFASTEVGTSEYGPVIEALSDRVFCEVTAMATEGYTGVVSGEVASVTVSDLADPLIHFRGRYRRID